MRFPSLLLVVIIAVCFSLSVGANEEPVEPVNDSIFASTATTPVTRRSVVPTAAQLENSTVPEAAAVSPSTSSATSPRVDPAIDLAFRCLAEPAVRKLLLRIFTNRTAGGRRESFGVNKAVSVGAVGLLASGDSLPTSRRGLTALELLCEHTYPLVKDRRYSEDFPVTANFPDTVYYQPDPRLYLDPPLAEMH